MFGGFLNIGLVGAYVLQVPRGGGKIWMYLDRSVK